MRNWPQFYPIIHHDIASEIPIHAQKLQYTAFASWLGTWPWTYISFPISWDHSWYFFSPWITIHRVGSFFPGLIACLVWNLFAVFVESIHTEGDQYFNIQSILFTICTFFFWKKNYMYIFSDKFLICRYRYFPPRCNLCNIRVSSFIHTLVQTSVPCDEVNYFKFRSLLNSTLSICKFWTWFSVA